MLILVCIWFIINSDTVHRKHRILIFKIIMFGVMRPHKPIGGYQGLGQDILPLWPV